MVARSPERSSATSKSKGQSRSGRETRQKIIEATLETVLKKGLVGTSARAIARAGEFNQALVFYHFGSIEELLLAALDHANGCRMQRFGPALERAETLADLLAVVERLFGSRAGVDNAAVCAIVAGWPARSDVGGRVVAILEPWEQLVQSALQRCLADSEVARVLPVADLSYVISSMVYGVEMMRRVDPDTCRAESTLSSLQAAADKI